MLDFSYSHLLIPALAVCVIVIVGWFVGQLIQNRDLRGKADYAMFKTPDRVAMDQVLETMRYEENSLRKEIDDLKAELEKYESEKKMLMDVRRDLTAAEAELIAKRDKLEQADRAEAQLNYASLEYERIQRAQTELQSTVARLTEERQQAEEQLKTIAKDLEEQQSQKNQLIAEIGQLTAQSVAARTEKDVYDKAVTSLKEAEESARQSAEEAVRLKGAAQAELKTLQTAVEKLQAERDQLAKVVQSLSEAEAKLKTIREECSAKDKEFKNSLRKLEFLNEQIRDKQKIQTTVDELRKEESSIREEIRIQTNKKADLNVELTKLSAAVASQNEILRKQGGEEGGDADPAAELKAPPELVSSLRPETVRALTAQEAESNRILDFCTALERAGLLFHKRTIKSFHTALKCQYINPLTVLAGVSGTGKTLLPIQYAKFMGMSHLTISVQPRWDSPQDLFGFYNYLEHRYRATELSRLLWAYQNDERLSNVMSLVLFDEMNLARTEYYFSDFLSKLELRRLGSSDANISLDIAQRTVKLPIPRSMLMVGTMNEDESTQTLSDKVLDRANVLRFGKPEKLIGMRGDRRQEISFPGTTVTKEVWLRWNDSRKLSSNQVGQVLKWIEKLNGAMAKVGRPFGYRVQEAMLEYVRLYPDADLSNVWKLAFADQIEQKILPKLRGLDVTEDYQNCIIDIENVIQDTGDQELLDALNRADRSAQDQGLFVWNGVSRKGD